MQHLGIRTPLRASILCLINKLSAKEMLLQQLISALGAIAVCDLLGLQIMLLIRLISL